MASGEVSVGQCFSRVSSQEPPQLIGTLPSFLEINSLKMLEGRFFTDEDNIMSAPVCVLGETSKVNLLGYERAVGKYVKVNSTWLQVIGVLAHQATADTDVEGMEVSNRNNLIISPLNTVMRRFATSDRGGDRHAGAAARAAGDKAG